MPEDPLVQRVARLRELMQSVSERAQTRHAATDQKSLPQPLDGSLQLDGDPVPLEKLIPGQVVSAANGHCFVRDTSLELGHRHGRFPLQSALGVDQQALGWLALPSEVLCTDLTGSLFLDVETTGLAGGTGTLAFLVGLAWFDGSRLTLTQLFMRNPAEEPAMLELLAGFAKGREVIVSFNGKVFDLPLLETRYTLARRRSPFPEDHIDLLAAARRVWRLRLASCRLAHIEERVLGVTRSDDVPGWMVPQLYAAYLRSGDGRHLSPVFDHNLLDVLSLVTLVGRLGHLHREPLLALDDDPTDLVALARCMERHPAAGRAEGAGIAECYRHALEHGLTGAGAAIARMRLAAGHKRLGEWDQATALWSAVAADSAEPWRTAAQLELAKWAEHRAKDAATALHWALQAQQAQAAGAGRAHHSVQHRIARLERKLVSTARAPGSHPSTSDGINNH